MNRIEIDVGVYTSIEVDLSGFDWEDVEKVVLTIRNYYAPDYPIVFEKEFEPTDTNIHEVVIDPELSTKIKNGAKYDFDKIMMDGKRYKASDVGEIVLNRKVGEAKNGD